MKLTVKLLLGMTLIVLSACTAPEIKKSQAERPAAPEKTSEPVGKEALQIEGETPPLTETKTGKTLKLVRMMDGGACKNEQEGVRGIFLLYADPDDVDRIKTEQGTPIFADFEKKIETLSSEALQQAVDRTVFALDPFALGIDDAHRKVADQFLEQFDLAIARPIDDFQKETSLTIDVKPFFSMLVFYTEGCEATHQHRDGDD